MYLLYIHLCTMKIEFKCLQKPHTYSEHDHINKLCILIFMKVINIYTQFFLI